MDLDDLLNDSSKYNICKFYIIVSLDTVPSFRQVQWMAPNHDLMTLKLQSQ